MISGLSKNKKAGLLIKRLFFPMTLVIFILTAIIFFIVSNIELYQKRIRLSERMDSLKKDIQISQDSNKELQNQIFQGQTESFLEKEAREKLDLKKPGENVVVVLPPKENAGKTDSQKSLWQKFIEKLGFSW